jgi:signal transduction histidine kinase
VADQPSAPDTPRLGPRLIDAGLAIFVIAVVAAAIWADVEGERHPSPAFAYVFAPVLGGLMWGRRRWPVMVLLATVATLFIYYVLGFPPVGVALPIAAAAYSVAESGRPRWAVGVSTAFVLVGTFARYLEDEDDLVYSLGYELPVSVTLLAAVIAFGDAVRSRRSIRAESRRRLIEEERQREQEGARLVEQERLRIARELHDVLAHTMSVISIQADVAAEALYDEPSQASHAIATIRQTSRDAGREIRSALGAVRGPDDTVRHPVPGLANLDRLVADAATSGLTVEVVVTGDPAPLPAVVDAAAHRIAQEAVTNVLSHAHTVRATIQLCYLRNALHLSVIDDGTSVRVNGDGYGIVGMRERAQLLGGTLTAGPGFDGGFTVTAVLPLEAPS